LQPLLQLLRQHVMPRQNRRPRLLQCQQQ
jgi:hypothetical protein